MDFDFDKDAFTKAPLFVEVAKYSAKVALNKTGRTAEEAKILIGADEYIQSISLSFGEILTTLEDLELIKQQLNDLKPVHHEYFNDKNPAHYIRYHIENLIFRVYKVKDQVLLLIKSILCLKVKNNLQLEKAVLGYLREHNIKLIEYWHLFNKTFDILKPYRNAIAHKSSLNYSNLSLVSSYFTFGMAEISDYQKHFEPLQYDIVSKCLRHFEIYSKNIDVLLKITCVTLAEPYNKNFQRLVIQGKKEYSSHNHI